jgi:Icc-related predicted phosphoesterase
MNCLFVSDLHGSESRYNKLLGLVEVEAPGALFIGGDLLPGGMGLAPGPRDAIDDLLMPGLTALKNSMGERYPRVFIILGNDDPRIVETEMRLGESRGIWEYIHNKSTRLGGYEVFGYACVPPTPFLLKDWERYDVSRYVDPACVSPEEGFRTAALPHGRPKYRTIAQDLDNLTRGRDLSRAILLFHTPPYQTNLDRAALDGRKIDHVPLDVNIGSIAVRRLIERAQPLLTLHGHVHESARLTGSWRDRLGDTQMISAAHDGPELAVVRFNPDDLDGAERSLL